MDPLSLIYWIKFCLGILAALICVLLSVNNIITGVMIGFITYIISDKVLRQLFIDKVDNLSNVTKTGIGIYIITFIFFWALLYTCLLYTSPSPRDRTRSRMPSSA